jgi:hypothetical protein
LIAVEALDSCDCCGLVVALGVADFLITLPFADAGVWDRA